MAMPEPVGQSRHEANTCYWPPSSGNGPHLRPDQVDFLTPEEMQDPFLAARWVARTEFHDLVHKGYPKSKKDGRARKGGRSASREAPSAKQRRGWDGARSATDESDSGATSSSTSLTGTAPSTRGTVTGRPRGDRRGNTYTRRATQQQREVAEQASRPDCKSRGQPFPIEMKEEGKRKQDRSVSSNRTAESAHRHKWHSGQNPNLDPDQSGTDDSVASGKEKAKNSTPSSGPKTSGGGSGFPRRYPDSSAVPIDSQCPGNGTVPESAVAVETVDSRVAYEGTPEKPILKYEDCLTLNKVGKPTTKFWTVDMLGVEQEGFKNTKKPIATVVSPARATLPSLPVWGSPNGWDYWGRPWAYMDAPHNCPDLKIMSVHKPPAARVTVTVLVNCDREPQYFPNLDVAKSAATASTWRGKKGKLVDGDGNYLGSDKNPTQAARQVLPRLFGSSNPDVEAIFKGWEAYRKSKIMWRPNPVMPEGDVTPDECTRARPEERLSKHRPFFTISATLPRNPVCLPAAEHVDQKEFPALEKSPYVGIGGIKGSNEALKATTQGEPAFLRPIDGQAAPRLKEATTGAVTTVTATPTTSAATPASAVSPLNGRQHQQALVKVDRMSDAQVQAAQKATSPKEAGSTSTTGTSNYKPSTSKEEAMDTDADQSTQQVTTGKKGGEVNPQRKSSRSASESRSRRDASSSQTGKTASTPPESKSQAAKSSTDKVQQALKKAGGLEPPRPDLGAITKHTNAKDKRAVGYRQEAFPAPTLHVVQPGGGHLREAPPSPARLGSPTLAPPRLR